MATIWQHFSWLTLFYALPRELVEKRPAYLELPRKPYSILCTHDYDKLLMDDAFLELVWDCYAWTAWQFFKVPDQQGGHQVSHPSCETCPKPNFTRWRNMDALRENTTKVRNIRQYLLATLYNAPLTISNHFRSLVNHDMY